MKSLSHVRLFATPWTIAYQAPPSMGFSRQEYWSGLPFPSPEHLLDSGIEPKVSCLAGGFFTTEPPRKPYALVDAPVDNVLWPCFLSHGLSFREIISVCSGEISPH